MERSKIKFLALLILFSLFVFYPAFSYSINSINCDNLYPEISAKCSVDGSCYKGLLILIGRDGSVPPTVKLISDAEKSVNFVPSKEGKVKVIAICFKPRVEVKKTYVDVKSKSFASHRSFLVALNYLNSGSNEVMVTPNQIYKCYWVHPFFNGTHYKILVDIYNYTEDKCNGIPIETQEIVVNKPTNVFYSGSSCVCSQKLLLEKTTNGIVVRGGSIWTPRA